MAQIIKEKIIIELSRIVKNTSTQTSSVISEDLLSTIESVSQELVGNQCVVEVSVLENDE